MGDEWRRRAAEDCPLVLFPSRGAPFTAEFFLGTTRSFQKQWLWADRTEESGFDKRRLPAPAASFLTSEGSAMLGAGGAGAAAPRVGDAACRSAGSVWGKALHQLIVSVLKWQ